MAPRVLKQVLRPFQQFARTESAGGILLLFSAAVALVWANSPWADSYFHFWETKIVIGAEGFGLTQSLHHWINDGLMAVFFFVVGLEIKREMLVGELASLRQAALPIAGAIGGMVVPALIYFALNRDGAGSAGWGIPMATDIAFALGVLAMLGPRVPLSLKLFLAALAIVDDIGAVLVIALFYTADISWVSLGVGAIMLGLLFLLNRAKIRHPMPYAILGVMLWLAFLKSGVHATVAGVLLAMTIPARTRIDEVEFLEITTKSLDDFRQASRADNDLMTNAGQLEAIHALEDACDGAQAPLLKMEDSLHGVVAFGIMPLFALANAGVSLEGAGVSSLLGPVSLGIILGLLVGKPLGITLLSWIAVRSGIAILPPSMNWKMLHAVSWLAGIGFTMSLFIAGLAFGGVGTLGDAAKIGILSASVFAGIAGGLLLKRSLAGAASLTAVSPGVPQSTR